MPQSLAQLFVHLVFSTKHRRMWLSDLELRNKMHSYLGGICRGLHCPAEQIGGVSDHVHVLCRLARDVCVADLLRELKKNSTSWFKTCDGAARNFRWQSGYGAFSVGLSDVSTVARYIAEQEHHHRQLSFQDEFRHLCQINGITIDERYAWD